MLILLYKTADENLPPIVNYVQPNSVCAASNGPSLVRSISQARTNKQIQKYKNIEIQANTINYAIVHNQEYTPRFTQCDCNIMTIFCYLGQSK